MKHILKITAVALTLGFAGMSVTTISSAIGGSFVAMAAQENQTLTFAIDKMTCAMCPITVRKAMEQVSGVKEVKVDFKAKTAMVTFDPTLARPSQIAAASTNAGYPAHIVEKTNE